MSSSSLSSSSSAEFGQYSSSSIFSQTAPVVSYSSSALMPSQESALSCFAPEQRIQLASRNIFHSRSSSFDNAEQINYTSPKASQGLKQGSKTKSSKNTLHKRSKSLTSFPKFSFTALPVDCLDNIFKFFSNKEYLTFSTTNKAFRSLIWQPQQRYLSPSYKNFLANIIATLDVDLKDMTQLLVTSLLPNCSKEIQQRFLENIIPIAKSIIEKSRKGLVKEISKSALDNSDLIMLIKFRINNSKLFQTHKKLTALEASSSVNTNKNIDIIKLMMKIGWIAEKANREQELLNKQKEDKNKSIKPTTQPVQGEVTLFRIRELQQETENAQREALEAQQNALRQQNDTYRALSLLSDLEGSQNQRRGLSCPAKIALIAIFSLAFVGALFLFTRNQHHLL